MRSCVDVETRIRAELTELGGSSRPIGIGRGRGRGRGLLLRLQQEEEEKTPLLGKPKRVFIPGGIQLSLNLPPLPPSPIATPNSDQLSAAVVRPEGYYRLPRNRVADKHPTPTTHVGKTSSKDHRRPSPTSAHVSTTSTLSHPPAAPTNVVMAKTFTSVGKNNTSTNVVKAKIFTSVGKNKTSTNVVKASACLASTTPTSMERYVAAPLPAQAPTSTEATGRDRKELRGGDELSTMERASSSIGLFNPHQMWHLGTDVTHNPSYNRLQGQLPQARNARNGSGGGSGGERGTWYIGSSVGFQSFSNIPDHMRVERFRPG